jgi:outer membrane protein assembly factor BamB
MLGIHAENSVQQEGSTRWVGFRGNHGTSHTAALHLPLTWSETENIAWAIHLPGYGQSSPVVWDGKVFVTTTEGAMKEILIVQCIEVKTGNVIWTKRFEASHKTERADMIAQAAPTPAVDAQNVYAFFESGDIFALDHQGEKMWHRSLTKEYGVFKGNHGISSSIAQTNDAIILLIDHDGPSYLMSISKKDGTNLWKNDREKRVSWTSPIVSNHPNQTELIISSNGVVEAYNVENGERIWYVEGIEKNTVPSPTITEKWIVVGSSQKGETLAIERGGIGDVAESHTRWKADVASSFGSPLIHRGRVYVVNKVGVLSCLGLDTGDVLWTTRIGSSTWASPIAADNILYFFGKDGDTTLLRLPTKQALDESLTEVVPPMSVNTLATESRIYGVAAVNGAFLIRTGKRLICVGQP